MQKLFFLLFFPFHFTIPDKNFWGKLAYKLFFYMDSMDLLQHENKNICIPSYIKNLSKLMMGEGSVKLGQGDNNL